MSPVTTLVLLKSLTTWGREPRNFAGFAWYVLKYLHNEVSEQKLHSSILHTHGRCALFTISPLSALPKADKDTSPGVVGEVRSKRYTLEQIAAISSQHTIRDKTALKTQFGVQDSPNPLLQLPIDLHRLFHIHVCVHV